VAKDGKGREEGDKVVRLQGAQEEIVIYSARVSELTS
jgi:hypothetical protein